MKTSNVTPMPKADPVAKTNPVPPPDNLEGKIRWRAYQLYEERGKTDGRELDDWLLAEAETMTHLVRQKAS